VKPLAEVPAYFITASLHACTHTQKKKEFSRGNDMAVLEL